MKRLADAVLKTAALRAIDQPVVKTPGNTSAIITCDHFAAARTMGDRWVVSTLQVIETLGATSFQRDCDALINTVNLYPNGIKLSDLYNRHRQLKKRDFDEILGALTVQDRIDRVTVRPDGKGRPAVVIRSRPRNS